MNYIERAAQSWLNCVYVSNGYVCYTDFMHKLHDHIKDGKFPDGLHKSTHILSVNEYYTQKQLEDEIVLIVKNFVENNNP